MAPPQNPPPSALPREEEAVRQLQAASAGRLFALRLVVLVLLLLTAQFYDGSLHAMSHWFVLGAYGVSTAWLFLGLGERWRTTETFAWAMTAMNAALAIYVIVEHMLAGAGAVDDGSDAISRLPAFLLLLEMGLSMRLRQTAIFAAAVGLVWGAAVLIGFLWPESGLLGPHVTLSDQVPGLLTFGAASLVILDGMGRLRGAVASTLRLETERTLLARFVPDRIARALAREGGIGAARERHACLLALDIRGFSRLTREEPPEAVVRALMAVRALAHAAVTEHGGIVDKYVGDAVLAQFIVGTPHEQARAALACARTIRHRLANLNLTRRVARERPLRVAVALHAGEVLVGVFDDGHRAEFTVLGPAMNTLARIETRAKAADLAVAASDDFLRLIGPGAGLLAVADGGNPALFGVVDTERA